MRYTNWHAILILAELREWYTLHENKHLAFDQFVQMVDSIGAEAKLLEIEQECWWRDALTEIAVADEVAKDFILESQHKTENIHEALKNFEILVLYHKVPINLIMQQVNNSELQLRDAAEISN